LRAQWHFWNSEEIDQIKDIIEFKTNPNSRRMIVSLESVLPDINKSFEENVANNKAALPPCMPFFSVLCC
jgi:thymidylate synthase